MNKETKFMKGIDAKLIQDLIVRVMATRIMDICYAQGLDFEETNSVLASNDFKIISYPDKLVILSNE